MSITWYCCVQYVDTPSTADAEEAALPGTEGIIPTLPTVGTKQVSILLSSTFGEQTTLYVAGKLSKKKRWRTCNIFKIPV
jgi:hypothetical protein